MDLKVSWGELKSKIDSLPIPFWDIPFGESGFFVWVYQGITLYSTPEGDDLTEYTNTYHPNANKVAFINIEKDTGLQRIRPREAEGKLYIAEVGFTTGDGNSLDDGGDGHYSLNCQTSGVTTVEFAPNYSYYLRGGFLQFLSDIATGHEITADFVLAPGSAYAWTFIRNLRFSPQFKVFDRIFPSSMTKYYSAAPILNTVRLVLNHDASENLPVKFWLEIYRP
ncbi:MAG TPA: hypothetical protein PKM65_20365 [Spirochaetota bacterium]|nr:hypothetical protein [Spirochaetota bacterium]